MATKTQVVIGDSGSEELDVLRHNYNALIDAIAAATTVADIQSALTSGAVKKVATSLELKAQPVFAIK